MILGAKIHRPLYVRHLGNPQTLRRDDGLGGVSPSPARYFRVHNLDYPEQKGICSVVNVLESAHNPGHLSLLAFVTK